MKKAIIFTIISVFLLSFAQSSIKIKKDDPRLNNRAYVVPQENTTRLSNPNTGIANAFSSRDALGTLLDSSSNGFGMVVSTTRPIDEENDQFQELGGDWWELDPSLKNLNVHTVIKPNQPQNVQI